MVYLNVSLLVTILLDMSTVLCSCTLLAASAQQGNWNSPALCSSSMNWQENAFSLSDASSIHLAKSWSPLQLSIVRHNAGQKYLETNMCKFRPIKIRPTPNSNHNCQHFPEKLTYIAPFFTSLTHWKKTFLWAYSVDNFLRWHVSKPSFFHRIF